MINNIKVKYKRLYMIWQAMKKRCNNPNCKDYPKYGGRGISVCREWNDSSEEFIKWALSNGYSEELTLDRKDNNGNYCPENCRWATWTQQVRNRNLFRNNKTGVTGVRICNGRYRASIRSGAKQIELGIYDNLEDAVEARKQGELKYWGTMA